MHKMRLSMRHALLLAFVGMLCIGVIVAYIQISTGGDKGSIVLDMTHAGNKGTFHVKISKSDHYLLMLAFYHDNSLSKGGLDELKRVIGFGGCKKQNGVIVPLRIAIRNISTSVNNPQLLYNSDVQSRGCTHLGMQGSFQRPLLGIDLDKGVYEVEVETLRDIPELGGRVVGVVLGNALRLP